MSTEDLKQRIQAARAFTEEVGGITYHLQRPTRTEYMRINEAIAAALRAATERGDVSEGRVVLTADELERLGATVRPHVTGWEGVTERDLGGAGDDPVSFDPGLLPDLLAENPVHADALAGSLMAAYDRYREEVEAEKKPSPSGSEPSGG
jgi:hypothetical protein